MINDDICYRFEQYKYTDGLLNDSVDATYILHLEDNGRLESIKKQLNHCNPTNIVYIVKNIIFSFYILYYIYNDNDIYNYYQCCA